MNKKNTLIFLIAAITLISSCSLATAQQKSPLKLKSKDSVKITSANIKSIEETGYARCLTVENELLLAQKYPKRASKEQFEEWLRPFVQKIKKDRLANKSNKRILYTIPVVIHIVHNGDPINTAANVGNGGENISDAQAISQINILNEDFRRIIGTPGGANSTGLAVDTEINFCLAQQDPNGVETTGIVRHNIAPYSNNVADGPGGADWETRDDVEQMKTVTQWDPESYLNMWTFRPGGLPLNQGGFQGLLGYAQFPSNSGLGGLNANGGAANTDGVTAGFNVFGSEAENDGTFVLNPTYNLGRTMTHEVGHWLGLRHIWGDGPQAGSCGVDDFCADTPNSAQPNFNCVANNSCAGSPTDQIQNYMDYTNDACMDTFTQDQMDRIQAVMGVSPRRMEMIASVGCQAPTPTIGFSTATQTVNEGTDCAFTDVTVTVKLAKEATANADITITSTGTASEKDFQIIGGNLTFPMGSISDQTFTVRIFNDGLVEADETITLGMNLNANGGDALITTTQKQNQIITIVSDDVTFTSTVVNDLLTFTGDTAGWNVVNADGGSTWGTLSGINLANVIEGDFLGSQADSPVTNDYIVSPAITIPESTDALVIEHALLAVNAAQNYELYFATDASTEATIQNGILLSNGAATNYTGNNNLEQIDISNLLPGMVGLTGSFVLRHESNNQNNGYLVWDTIRIIATSNTQIQTTVNTNTSYSTVLNTTGTIYADDTTTENAIATITSNTELDYGCVNVEVSRNSGTSVIYQTPGIANFVMGKTVTITPATIQANGNATVKFYFTEAEINQWETETGNNRSALRVIKDNSTPETATTTIGAFGSNITLEATFTSGINGVYYFGTEQTLSIPNNQFSVFNVYPNPTHGEVTLVINTNENAINVSLFDIRGRKVYDKLYNNTSNIFETRVNFTEMASGIYLLEVEAGDKKAIKKIVIK